MVRIKTSNRENIDNLRLKNWETQKLSKTHYCPLYRTGNNNAPHAILNQYKSNEGIALYSRINNNIALYKRLNQDSKVPGHLMRPPTSEPSHI
jgi:hypothetical protein